MEYCPRGNLDDYLHRAQSVAIPQWRKLRFIIHIARGMAYLHSQVPCVLHRCVEIDFRSILGLCIVVDGHPSRLLS